MRRGIVMILLILTSFLAFGGGKENYIRGSVIEKVETLSPEEYEEEVREIDVYRILLKEGIDKGREVEVEFPIYREEAYNIPLKAGMDAVIYTEIGEDGSNIYYIVDIDKRSEMLVLSFIFVALTFLLARFKGIKALLSLGVTVAAIFYLFIPGVIRGYSPVVLSVVMALFASVITIYSMAGFSRKGVVAILGSIGGVAFAGILSILFSGRMGLIGFADMDSLNFIPLLKGIKIKELISAGVILGSMGAVMDVAMSIASALHELKEAKPDISPREVFLSGMRIGSDVIGTMVNILILAYAGSSLFTVMILVIQRSEYPMIRILNFEFMAVEVLRSLCGSLGILLAVPITSYLSAYTHIDEGEKPEKIKA